MNVAEELERLFPGHRSPARAADWMAIRARWPLGSPVQGVVVARYPFGVFVDLHVGFPALLLVVRFRDADSHPATTPEAYPAIGSVLEACVCAWADDVRQIGLTQLSHQGLPAGSPRLSRSAGGRGTRTGQRARRDRLDGP